VAAIYLADAPPDNSMTRYDIGIIVAKAGNMSAEIDPNLSYDAALLRLEEILNQLERGDLPLEQTLTLYEDGATLAKLCATRLDEAELRVRQWQTVDQTAPFEGWQEP
jgi:exodeoxyribonuclease VII small subunit